MSSPKRSSSPEKFSDQSAFPTGILPAEQGKAMEADADNDVRLHNVEMNNILLTAYNASQSHIIALKKRLVEEKEIALMEYERNFLNQYDRLQTEIRSLQHEIRVLNNTNLKTDQNYDELGTKTAVMFDSKRLKYGSQWSVAKLFRAWHDELNITRQSNKLDAIAKAFQRKYLLAKTFLTMTLNSHHRKANKQNAEAKFKFDSVTSEVRSSFPGFAIIYPPSFICTDDYKFTYFLL
jgi:TolA-binding protein